MPEIRTKPFAKKTQKETDSKSLVKSKVSESKGKPTYSANAGKKRKLDQLEHVPTLVSSTFNPLEEVDFPRGGSALTPLEKKQAEQEGIRDALFEVHLFLMIAEFRLRRKKRRRGRKLRGEKTPRNMIWKRY